MTMPEESRLSEHISSASFAVARVGNKASLAINLVRMVDRMDDNYPIPYDASPIAPELHTFYQNATLFIYNALHDILKDTKELHACVDKLSACAACVNCANSCPHGDRLSVSEGGV